MANRNKRLNSNVPGNFYVDATCIDCDTCRQLAPRTFEEAGGYSTVIRQPQADEEVHRTYQALLACPVGSIGTERSDRMKLKDAMASFPLHLEGGVYYCGFNSEQSFGANSYFIAHPHGNWLVDSPRYLKKLAEAFERMGGLSYIFLTHEDDVADADKYASHFGAKRIIHRADALAVPDAEWVLDGTAIIQLKPDFQVIPVPGHTPGSQALLYADTFLFTGDHLWWEPGAGRLGSPKELVWRHDELLRSIERLLHHRFEWVLAGHGDRVHLPPEDMHAQLQALVDRRKRVSIG
jgi:glyoxylase-like metal-dependent hydrolase (beta-lactamase superfamily II)/ferredoxin